MLRESTGWQDTDWTSERAWAHYMSARDTQVVLPAMGLRRFGGRTGGPPGPGKADTENTL